jgi:hypothetical protein
MKYANGFTINATGSECFITYLQTRPQGQAKTTEETETVVMSEQCARQLAAALEKVYQKVDADRAAKRKVNVNEAGPDILS